MYSHPAKGPSDRAAGICVWGVWLAMLLIVLVCFIKYARNIPFSEDWLLVPPLTGHESNLFSWTWSQHNEHRIPLPRLILFSLLKGTGGDFRSGMLLNIGVLAALSAALMYGARRVRGRTSFLDVIFPIGLLHLGNWENLFWGWQFTQVLPTALLCIILVALVLDPNLAMPRSAVVACLCLVLLPLSGANGLLAAPFLALWVGYTGWRHWRSGQFVRIGGLLLGSAAAALCLIGVYFVGYHPRSYGLAPPHVTAAVYGALQFVALSFGPVSRSSWALSLLAAIALLLATAALAVHGAVRTIGPDRQRAMGLLVIFSTMALSALAIGWGRAQVLTLPEWGGIWPARYCLMAVPLLFLAFFLWELYGPSTLRTPLLGGLVVLVIVLLPYNTLHGLWWRDWYLQGVEPFARDLRAGLSRSVVAERHREFLFRWMDPSFDKLRMLQEARIGMFAAMTGDALLRDHAPHASPAEPSTASPEGGDASVPLVAFDLRYAMPEADEVYLVWGLNGWRRAHKALQPPGTRVHNDLMQTPMVGSEGTFVASLRVPAGATVNYCFLITKTKHAFDVTWPVCEGDYRDNPVKDTTTAVRSKLTFALVNQEIRYVLPEAEEVYLVWGLNGWHPAPESLFPEGTIVKDRVMQTAMHRKGEAFLATVRIPAGTTLDYGFRITKRRGLFDLVYPVWEGDYRSNSLQDGRIETKGKAKLVPDLSQVIQEARLWKQGR